MEIKRPQHLDALQAILKPYRYLVCVDLEATCDELPDGLTEVEKASYPLLVKRNEMETIEVGAVVLDLHNDFEQVAQFCRFIQPQLKPVLTPFCTRLTTITQADVDDAAGYDEVRLELAAFLAPFEQAGYMWGSWGEYDAKQLADDAARLGVPAMLAGVLHTNLKKWHWKIHHCRAMGLQAAVGSSGLEWRGQCHRGIDDAINLGNLAAKILREPSLS